jgi:hypothetical protein
MSGWVIIDLPRRNRLYELNICVLFNVARLIYRRKVWRLVNMSWTGDGRQQPWPSSMNYPNICLKGLRKISKNSEQPVYGQDSNPTPSGYEVGMLTTHPIYDLFSYCPPTYVLVFLVVSFLLVLPPISYMHSSSTHSCYMPRPSSFF